MIQIKGPTADELHAMISEAKRAVKGLKDDLRTALLDGAATGGIRDRITDATSRIRSWEAALEEIAEQAAKATAGRVSSLRFEIAAAATASILDLIGTLKPPPFPVAQTQGVSQ